MVYALLMRDVPQLHGDSKHGFQEQVGLQEPLRQQGIQRQLEARKAHNTWAQCFGSAVETWSGPFGARLHGS